jgi:hypothetical protein
MSPDELKAELADVVGVLTALEGVLPGRVDPALTEYLERASKGGVELEMLHHLLSGAVQKNPAPLRMKATR